MADETGIRALERVDGAGNRLVAEMVRMLVGAARYIPSSNGCT